MSNLINREALKTLMLRLAPKGTPDPTEDDVEAFVETFEELIQNRLIKAIHIVSSQVLDPEDKKECKLMSDKTVNSKEDLVAILKEISFAPSCVNLDWQWDIEQVYGEWGYQGSDQEGHSIRGWLVNTSFVRPDTATGEVSRGKGRQEFVAVGASESGVVKTCWVLAEMIVHHELMEAFLYKGSRIFDPHNTTEELTVPQKMKVDSVVLVNGELWWKKTTK